MENNWQQRGIVDSLVFGRPKILNEPWREVTLKEEGPNAQDHATRLATLYAQM